MFTSIRRYTVKRGSAPELARRVQDGFVPLMRQIKGFIPTGRTVDSNVNRCDAARCASPSLAGNGDGNDGSDHTAGAPGD
jgi:hypothetical protein